jgi:hypothetical protein
VLLETAFSADGTYRDPLYSVDGAIVGPEGDVAMQGVDVVSGNDDGRIQSVTGFFGELS